MGRYSPRAQYRVSHPCRLFWKYVSEVEPGSPHERLHSRDRSAHSNSGPRPGNDNQRDDNYLQTLPGNARLSGRAPSGQGLSAQPERIQPVHFLDRGRRERSARWMGSDQPAILDIRGFMYDDSTGQPKTQGILVIVALIVALFAFEVAEPGKKTPPSNVPDQTRPAAIRTMA